MFFNRRKKKYDCMVTYMFHDAHGIPQYRNLALVFPKPVDPRGYYRLAELLQVREKSPKLPVILNLIWF